MSEVLLVRTNNRSEGMYTIFSYFKQLFDSFQGKSVLIKPNFNTADPPPASTDMSLLRTLIQILKDCGAAKIIVGERSGPADTEETMRVKGLFDLQTELGGFEIINFASLADSDWVHFQSEQSHWKDGFLFAKPVLDADAVIALPCLKTHRFGGHFTLSLKLAVGMVPRQDHPYMKELHSSPHQRSLIAEVNQVYSPTLVILDGVDAFVEGGPADGTLVHPHVMLASVDRIAIDAVGVAILRDHGTTPEVSKGSIFEQEQIARAVELGLGVKSPAEINLRGANAASEEYASHIKALLA
ncbi:MAG: DUF362 domain-containing protein [Promethearchaeota archaeon]